MKRLLVVLFLSLVFFLPSFASDEKDKNIPWYLSSPGHYGYSTYPPSLFDPNYLDKHNRWQEYFNSFIHKPRRSAVVLYQPPSFGESFLQGFSEGFSKSLDYHYRRKEQERYTNAMLGLLKLKWASEKKYKPDKGNTYTTGEGDWAYRDRVRFLGKYDPTLKFEWVEKEEDDLAKYMRSIGAVHSWQYKTEKLNEYLKSLGLSPVPTNVDVRQVFDGDWVIYWDGEKWARKKKGVNQENP